MSELSCLIRLYWTLANQSEISFLHGHGKIHLRERSNEQRVPCDINGLNICSQYHALHIMRSVPWAQNDVPGGEALGGRTGKR